ncbi:alkaline ceramidase protein [Rutstroemia sp. NJR-2017a BBW]|nr:alkaline ceramidase protein [Rutstroemia sp. NJR-2017a BBW]
MRFRLPSIPYPPPRPQEGYWAPVTSTINWCEEDYYATIYSAEIVNTLTNLLFLYLGIKGARNCIKYGHDSVFLVAFIGYTAVGTGSFLFHSTLKYPMQLVDELSMIYTTCLMCYATFSFSKSRLFRQFLAAGLVSLSVFITLYYHYLQDPDFHQNAFALLTAAVLFRSMYIMKHATSPEKQVDPDSLTSAQLADNNKRLYAILKEMWLLVGCGLSIFLGGFGIWSLDNHYCSTIRTWRHEIGLPWGLLLEGHGWWHLMTGIGSYFYLVWGIWLRHCLNERQDTYFLNWPSWVSLPEVVPITASTGDSKRYTTGASKRETKKVI